MTYFTKHTNFARVQGISWHAFTLSSSCESLDVHGTQLATKYMNILYMYVGEHELGIPF